MLDDDDYSVAARPITHRRYAPKVRTGCSTCKIRRVKCDEGKPSCKRCISTGRKCDGYASLNKAICTQSGGPGGINPALTLDVPSDNLERRTFDFFRSKTAPSVSGFFKDAVWYRTVLQVSHSEPAVRYAINALGALHEETVLRKKAKLGGLPRVADCRTSFPIKQYTKAISETQKLLESKVVPIDVVILCSIVFMHFEAITESFLPALLHLESAIRMLRSKIASREKSIDADLVQAVMRLDIQGSMYLGMRIPGLPFSAPDSDDALPLAFRSLNHARDVIDTRTCQLFHFMRVEADDYKFRSAGNVPLETLAKAQDFERISLDLDELLHEFMKSMSSRLTKREQHGLDMLRTRVKINKILSATCLYTEATMYDNYLEDFEEILALCKYTINSDDIDSWLFSISLDEGLVVPLWFVATACRDGRTRHRALALLKNLRAREGIWYIEAQTQIADACVRFEEELCEKEYPTCEDIPEWRRVHSSGLDGWDVWPVKTTVNAQLRIRPNGPDGEWCAIQEPVELRVTEEQKDIANMYQTPGLAPHLGTVSDVPLSKSRMWVLSTEPWMTDTPFRIWATNDRMMECAKPCCEIGRRSRMWADPKVVGDVAHALPEMFTMQGLNLKLL